MDTIRKSMLAQVVKAEAPAEGEQPKPITVICSTPAVDRYGDTIAQDGWELENYKANPVVLWMHDRMGLPVGTAQNIRVEGDALKAEVVFAQHQQAKDIEQAVRDGVVRAISVGFIPLEYGPRKSEDGSYGLAFTKQELTEFSFCTVQANPEAIVESKSARDALVEKAFNAAAPEGRVSPRNAAPTEEEAMTDEEKAAAQAQAEKMKSLEEKVAAFEKRLQQPVTDHGEQVREIAGAPHVAKFGSRKKRAPIEQGKDNGLGIARVAMAHAYSRMNPGMSSIEAAKELGFGETADAMDAERSVRKAVGESSVSTGGSFVPEVMADTFIDELHPVAVVRNLIPASSVLRLTRGDSLSVPEITGRPTSYFLGEAQSPTNSTPGFAMKNIDTKWMATEVVIGKDWLSDAVVNGDQLVRDLMVRSAALREDLALIEGKGTEYEPKGIKLLAGYNKLCQANPDYDKSVTDLDDLEYALENAGVVIDDSFAYVGHPRHFKGLRGFKDTDGDRTWRDEMKNSGTLNGHKFAKSSQLNITAANSCFYGGQFSEAMLVEKLAMEIEEDNTYTAGGVAKSASSSRQIVLRLWRRFGFGAKHAAAFGYLHTCTWGA